MVLVVLAISVVCVLCLFVTLLWVGLQSVIVAFSVILTYFLIWNHAPYLESRIAKYCYLQLLNSKTAHEFSLKSNSPTFENATIL